MPKKQEYQKFEKKLSKRLAKIDNCLTSFVKQTTQIVKTYQKSTFFAILPRGNHQIMIFQQPEPVDPSVPIIIIIILRFQKLDLAF